MYLGYYFRFQVREVIDIVIVINYFGIVEIDMYSN